MDFGGRLNLKYHNSRLTSASQATMPSSPTPRRTRLPASPPTRLRQLRATSSLLDFAKRQCLFCRKDANRAKLPWSGAHRNALDRLLRIAPPVDYGDGVAPTDSHDLARLHHRDIKTGTVSRQRLRMQQPPAGSCSLP